jgi:hypothetical protein
MVEPFHLINNGDWVGQLANKLEHTSYYGYTCHHPNGSVVSLELAIDEWVKTKIRKMNAHDLAEIMAGKDKTNG